MADTDRSFVAKLDDYSITTAKIYYFLPDHPHILQWFLWQDLDLAPRFPRLSQFLDFWERNIEGRIHRIKVGSAALIKPAEYRFSSAVNGLYLAH